MTSVIDRTVREPVYQALQAVLGRHAALRHGARFDSVKAFCLFVGYPRSGHSLVGAFVNAHRNAVVSHELDAPAFIRDGCSRDQLYARILARAWWFDRRGNTSNYRYQIPEQWQGRFQSLEVIGDKRGGTVTRSIEADATFLDKVRTLVGIPIRLIHVVRNPFDNIAAISIWHDMSLREAADYYFRHCAVTGRLETLTTTDEVITVPHEDLVRNPHAKLEELCSFLGLSPDEDYLSACAAIVFPRPTGTRTKVDWDPALLDSVRHRASEYGFLTGYRFD